MTELVDSHAHIHGREYDADRSAVLERAHAAGVVAIVCAGTDLESSARAVRLAEQEPGVWATVGVHPHDAAAATDEYLRELSQLAGSGRVVAFGEIGLDFYRDLSPRERQRQVFREQLALSDRLGLPVVVHSRDADEVTFSILTPWVAERRAAGMQEPFGMMHCFSYGPDRLNAYLKLGMYISIAGTVTYPKAALVRGAAVAAPAASLLVETDCPYLTPQSRRGRRNEPSLLIETVSQIASLRGRPIDDVSMATTANALRLFRLSGAAFEQRARGVGTL
ncbi:MAG: TatD family hydrolase [Dehalococcoidia bacterium]